MSRSRREPESAWTGVGVREKGVRDVSRLILGPLLRYVDETRATVWVETDRPCVVEVLGHRSGTFHVAGHHFGLVVVEGLESGQTHPYEVRLDDRRVWPVEPDSPPSVIRTFWPGAPVRMLFGSCLAAAPHAPPFSLPERKDEQGLGPSALHAMALQMRMQPVSAWPQVLLLLGDQVYADSAAPETRKFIRERRRTDRPPGDEVADFEEYTRLYQESWGDPLVRWLLSTLSVSMIFDDHDVIDDWNISEAWVRDIRRQPWWEERVAGALMAYWLYQHLGNLRPEELEASELLARIRDADDGAPLLREFALRADRGTAGTEGARWSYRRDLGRIRVIVVDSRNGRVLDEGRRTMIDEDEWAWLEEQTRGAFDHLIVATSLPYLLPPGIAAAESWSEALCDGSWGPFVARVAERMRRAGDLEHWSAFRASFERLTLLLRDVTTGAHGRPPASVLVLSGDVHYSYLAKASLSDGAVQSPLFQVTSSPMRYRVKPGLRRAFAYGTSWAGHVAGRALALTVGRSQPIVDWTVERGPWFDNSIATLDLDPQHVRLRFCQARIDDHQPYLESVADDWLV